MIRIIAEQFDPGTELSAFEERAGDAGAIVTFVGKVRSKADNASVNSLYLEHYAGMSEKSVLAIEAQAMARWALSDLLIIHRFGDLLAGEPIVMVCAAAAHRRDAFEAADFVMDFLKADAMFWKKERRSDGEAWIEPREGDYNDAARWPNDGRKTGKGTAGARD
ncbi:molybdenum cofactor biosynthesis protein MoaE [Hyphococcus sp.]|uniref:molybdenum cofactor biosynthesis protein MoaE n=1 Tax=Hyphococcus sp. TaxID=2038636 RepID=UPI00207E6126|nr:MAG: molybdenum cofactor biosynthesis protein MoaE [Marinicaulis sp.]